MIWKSIFMHSQDNLADTAKIGVFSSTIVKIVSKSSSLSRYYQQREILNT